MGSFLELKPICNNLPLGKGLVLPGCTYVLANFMILSDSLLFRYFSLYGYQLGKTDLIWVLLINSTI